MSDGGNRNRKGLLLAKGGRIEEMAQREASITGARNGG
ncbi:hypothetical protein Kole_1755 [Kosmotoga olearia TBF 19.5.1]|uniref:Uncharacterized protein n=1 Tax=Kosmotoga olearia (strain ATCC BAA-1733 / DSM 21960 / TBF 19.5.1) TaxID=521045 RepID=C5CFU6_KOSOT|nr:hypothetical protein Kole_1755 [Kosmotoga olearia TBF 19.5.1]